MKSQNPNIDIDLEKHSSIFLEKKIGLQRFLIVYYYYYFSLKCLLGQLGF